MHILSTIGLFVCIIGLAAAVTTIGTYITDRFDDFFVYMLSMAILIIAALAVCYSLSLLISLE